MTINLTEISKATKKGLDINEYIYLLCSLDGSLYIFENQYFKDTIVNLRLKGYLQGDAVTKAGKDLIKEISGDVSNKVDSKIINCKTMREELQNCLLKNHGKKQVKGFGDVYFIPTETELIDSLKRFWKNYPDYKDTVKITEILKNHIETCSKKNKFSPAIRYFIIKMGNSGISSPLGAAYDDWDNEKQEIVKQINKGTIDI